MPVAMTFGPRSKPERMKTPIARSITRIGTGEHIAWSLYPDELHLAVKAMAKAIRSQTKCRPLFAQCAAIAALASLGIDMTKLPKT